jgi:hypothetical protein
MDLKSVEEYGTRHKVGEIPINTVESDGTFLRYYYQSISCHTISESSFSVLQHFNITIDSKILL